MSSLNKVQWPDLELPPINLLSLGREDSPCRGKCELSDGECLGCFRKIEEIELWGLYEPNERWHILTRIYNEHPEVFSKTY